MKIIINLYRAVLMAALTLPLQPRASAAIHVWSGAGINANWNNGNNWVGGATPTAAESAPVIIEFPANINGSVTNNIPGLKVDSLRLLGSGLTLNGVGGVALTLRGGNSSTNLYSAGVNYVGSSLPLALEGSNIVEAPVLLTIYSAISGPGGLSIAGSVRFDGAIANSYSGQTTLRGGMLLLNRQLLILGNGPLGLTSVPGALLVKKGSVTYGSDNGVADDAVVTVEAQGTLDLDGYDDEIGGLNLAGGTIETGAGVLTLNGGVSATVNAGLMNGKLSLGGSTRTFNISPNCITTINAAISGGSGIGQAGLTKTGTGELRLTTDNSYPGQTTVNDGTLEIRTANSLGSNLFGGATVAAPATLSLADGVIVVGKPLALNGGKLRATGSASWTGPVTLNGDCVAQCSFTGSALNLTGVLGGNGNLTHIGNGKLALLGTNANTFTGTLGLTDGVLELGKSGGQVAISGSLVIGGPFHPNNADYVFLTAPGQIAPGATVSILPSGLLNLNGQNETLEALSLQGGEVQTAGGTLTLGGPLTANASSQTARIAGKLALSMGTNSFHVLPGGNGLEISAVISGLNNATLSKDGDGELALLGDNTFSGPTVVNAGWLVLRHAHGLGDANPFNSFNGTFVTTGATLALDSATDVPEKLTMSGAGTSGIGALFNQVGNNSWSGPITLASNCVVSTSFNAPLVLNGVISGNGGLTKRGMADLTFAGNAPNTFSGATCVESGRLLLAKPAHMPAVPANLVIGELTNHPAIEEVLLLDEDQIAGSATVTLHATGRLNLANHDEAFNQLLGSGEIVLGYARLTVARGSFDGSISGLLGSLAQTGNQVLSLNGTNTYTGETLLLGGTMMVNGSTLNSTFYVTNNGTLGGHGIVGTVHLTGGKLAPSTTAQNQIGRLTSGAVYESAYSTFAVDLAGELPGTQHDQLVAKNIVQLQGQLLVTLVGNTASGDVFTIIKKDSAGPVMGTFASLPEGQTFYVSSRPFQITYTGGDGNDVVLTQTGQIVVPQMDGITKLPNGHPQVNGTGIPFHLYSVERSEDLQHWITLDTVAADDAGKIHCEDPDGFSLPKAFYRLLAVEDNGQL